MKTPRFSGVRHLALVALAGVTWHSQGQLTVGTAGSNNSPILADPPEVTLQAFLAEQETLNESIDALVGQGATPDQLQAWQQQNQGSISAQQYLAFDLAMDSALQPLSLFPQPTLPATVSSSLSGFLATQAALANGRAQIHNQLLNALPQNVTDAQIAQMQRQEDQLFSQQYAADLQLQAQQSQTMVQASAQTPLLAPPALKLPTDCSPNLAAFLTLRDQLIRDQIQMSNQQINTSPAVKAAAMQQWQQQNASDFQQMQALMQALAN